jgi:malate dehydrogenase (oxaloacetate-decarboxylating)
MMISKDELLKKAEKPSKDALKLHPYYKGKVQVTAKCCIRGFDDFAIWYTPGVASPCLQIKKDPLMVYEHTNKGNFVAVMTDGSRVLGLGNIGPEASMPVMEGKALLFKYLGGVDAFPICIDTTNEDEFIRTVLLLQPSFGGINLEDIEQPKCFSILDRLRKECRIPVWHDDQQGTATVTLAGLINALKYVGKPLDGVKIAMIGAGASNICIARVLISAGVPAGNIVMCDSKGILHTGRKDLEHKYPQKWEMCQKTNRLQITGGIKEALRGSDVCISLSAPGPDIIKPEWVSDMAKDAIVFACANPIPEIWPWEAKEAGARIVSTGRSDFPNQVNNSLGFPGIFRGTLDVRARGITDEMCIAAAYELAKCAEDRGISEDFILPTMQDWEVFPREAAAVGMKAIQQGIAQRHMNREELLRISSSIIKESRQQIESLMKEGIIKLPERDVD